MRNVSIAMLLSATLCCLLGCKAHKEFVPGITDNPGWGSVQIYMPTDTLRILPGDSASAEGFVVVKDDQQNVVPGIKVTIELTVAFGVIEIVGTDTSNATGRVSFWFRTFRDETGTNVIYAHAGTVGDTWPITVEALHQTLGPVDLTVLPDALFSLRDSVRLTACVTDAGHVGVPGVSLPMYCTGGRLTALPPTGSSGCAHTYWYPTDYGYYRLWSGPTTDTVSITVSDTTSGG